jgi:hypothetical protein
MTDPHASDHARRGEPSDDVPRADAGERSGVPVDPASTGAPVGMPPTPGEVETRRSLEAGESRYSPAPAQPVQGTVAPAPSESRFDPLAVRVELVTVGGPAAKELLRRQAGVITEALRWFADHRLDEPGA